MKIDIIEYTTKTSVYYTNQQVIDILILLLLSIETCRVKIKNKLDFQLFVFVLIGKLADTTLTSISL